MVFPKPNLIMPPVIVPLKEKPKQPANATSGQGNSIALKIVWFEGIQDGDDVLQHRGLRGLFHHPPAPIDIPPQTG